MLTKVTFEPLKGRRYRVRKNGEFVIRNGKPLIVNEASIAGTRQALMNEGCKPPPPLEPFKRAEPERTVVHAEYSSFWKETQFTCPLCDTYDYRDGYFPGPTSCRSCNRPLTIVLAQATPAANNPLDGIFNASHHLL